MFDRARRVAADDGLPIHVGGLLTVDRVVGNVEEKRALAAETGAAAVDMESGAVAEAALAAAVEVVAVRAILDPVAEPLDVPPDRFLHPDGSLAMWKNALYVEMRPGRLPALWALGQRSEQAMHLVVWWLCRFFDDCARASV